MSTEIIAASSLTKRYGSTLALSSFDLRVRQGEFVALLGANGAGKSTIIRILLGIETPEPPPDGGESTVMGHQSAPLPPRIRERIGYVSDDASPIPWANARDIGHLYGTIYSRWDSALFSHYMKSWNLDPNQKLHSMSKGQKRLTEFCLVLSFHPDLLILDEPFNGLDAINRIHVQDILRDLQRSKQTTILYTTHVLEEVSSLADRLVIIRAGKKVRDAQINALPDTVEAAFRADYGVK